MTIACFLDKRIYWGREECLLHMARSSVRRACRQGRHVVSLPISGDEPGGTTSLSSRGKVLGVVGVVGEEGGAGLAPT